MVLSMGYGWYRSFWDRPESHCSGETLNSRLVVFRNLILTHNPVFPWKSGLFGSLHLLSAGSASVTEGFTKYRFNIQALGGYFVDLFWEIPLILSLGLTLAFKNYRSLILKRCAAPLTALLFYLIFFRSNTETRLLGPSLLICCFLGAYFGFFVIEQLFKNNKNFAGSLLVIGILVNSNISIYTLTQLRSDKFFSWSKQVQKQNEIGSPNKEWIRSHLSNQESILVGGDGYIYYLIDYPLTNYTTVREYEKAIATKDIPLALTLFRNAPYHYLYLAGDIEFLLYRDTLNQVIDAMQAWNQECKIFGSGHNVIWDLTCLQKESPPHTLKTAPKQFASFELENDQSLSKTE
jgi:hypothetical protein